MDYKAQSCVSCGSDALKLISHKLTDGNVFYTYRCEACGETFSTESAYLARKAKEEKRAAIEQAAKQKKAAPAPSGSISYIPHLWSAAIPADRFSMRTVRSSGWSHLVRRMVP